MERESKPNLLQVITNCGKWNPGIYLYLGRYEYDRDTLLWGWSGPFGSTADAKKKIPKNWNDAYKGETPHICFRLFEPLKYDKRP